MCAGSARSHRTAEAQRGGQGTTAGQYARPVLSNPTLIWQSQKLGFFFSNEEFCTFQRATLEFLSFVCGLGRTQEDKDIG